MNYEVVREDESKKVRFRWRFWVNGTRVILDKFYRESRSSTRHKYRWINSDCYDRIDRRNGLLPVHAVPQPKDVRFDVLRQIVDDLRVVIHDGRDVEAPFAPDFESVPFPMTPTHDALAARSLVEGGRITAAGRKALKGK